MLVVQLYVYGAWISHGPHQITRFQNHHDISWTMARVYESIAVLGFVVCVIHAIRSSRRLGRLSFDAKLVIASLSIIWLDAWTDLVAPIWLYSSQWFNLNMPLGYLPGVINPVLREAPFPVFHFFNYTVALLGAAILVSLVMRRIKARWPALSTAQLIGVVAVLGMAFDVVYELPLVRLRLWAMPGFPDWLALFPHSSVKFSVFEIVPAGLAFASFGALRYFRDGQGDGITERGIRSVGWRRTAVSILALMGTVQLVWLGCTTTQIAGGFYAARYRALPPSLVNGLCDAPLTGGGRLVETAYGPCPHEGGPIPVRRLERPADTARPCVVDRNPAAPRVPWPPCPPDPSRP